MRKRPEVTDVLVEVTTFDEPEWPFSEAVYFVTSASTDDVTSWFPEKVAPSETDLVELEEFPPEIKTVRDGMNLIRCWWD